MSRRPKFRPGGVIRDPIEAVRRILAGEWLYYGGPPRSMRLDSGKWLGGRPVSPAWLRNMSLATIEYDARRGCLLEAIPNEEKNR